jgi:histidine triad (HIT) family protein
VTERVTDCIFCAIAGGTAPRSLVYEDEDAVAFMDIAPINPGHTLIVPKEHSAYLADLDPDTGGHLFRVGMRVAQAIRRSGLRCEGVNFFLADGEVAGQEVFHVHLHVVPRFEGDNFQVEGDWVPAPRDQLDAAAARLRAVWPADA